MFKDIVAFYVMINPFALFIYLIPIMDELHSRKFIIVLLKASLISFAIYFLFLLTGTALFRDVFNIEFDSFKIFSGIVIFSFAYFYIVKGQKALLQLKEDLDDLASEIALPFMVGAGTLSLTFLYANTQPLHMGTSIITISLAASVITIIIMKFIKDNLISKFRIAFDKVMGIFMRLNGFFVGAIGVDLILSGIKNLYFSN